MGPRAQRAWAYSADSSAQHNFSPAQGLFSALSGVHKECHVPSPYQQRRRLSMRRILLLLSVVAAVTVASTLPAIAQDGKVQRFAQDETLGFYRGTTVAYLDFGPVKLSAGNKVAPIWAFTNGAGGQHNIIDTVPGRRDYTPLWAVRLVTWKDGQTARVLRSAAAVRRALAAGQVSIKAMPVVVNCPVL
jgi:hypothetical protein